MHLYHLKFLPDSLLPFRQLFHDILHILLLPSLCMLSQTLLLSLSVPSISEY